MAAGDKQIFVLGLDDFNRRLLESIQDIPKCAFHTLLSTDEVMQREHYAFWALLDKAEQQLRRFQGSIDAVVGYIDFPVSDMIPILCARFGLPHASLEAVLKCEHKYWGRWTQQQVVDENIPKFQAVNPFDPAAAESIDLDFPFWLKPVKSFSSFLGFLVSDREELRRALGIIRERIHRLGAPFNKLLRLVRMPDAIAHIDGTYCIAESLIGGEQCTVEGYVFNGEAVVYGVVDSLREAGGSSFTRYQYPSKLPPQVQQRMADVAKRVMQHYGFDGEPFNIEFFYERERDQIWVLEINPRISQSHSPLFAHVDGASNHKVMLELGLARRPHLPHRCGTDAVAAKFMLRVFHDGVVERVPTEQELAALRQEIPGALIKVHVSEGMRLSSLLNQDSYSFEVGVIFLGARDERELDAKLVRCKALLPLEIRPLAD